MPIEDIQVGVTGGVPAADSNEYVLFDSTACSPPMNLTLFGIDRGQFYVDNSQNGALKSYRSPDKGVTWNLNSVTVVAAGSGVITSGTAPTPYDFGISGFVDWKLAWLNAGAAQSSSRWQPTLTLTSGQKVVG